MTLLFKRSWGGGLCCFILFILAFVIHNLFLTDSAPASGKMDPGMLFFIVPGVLGSFCARRARFLAPMVGALVAVPVCLLLINLLEKDDAGLFQELAWLLGAVFWNALGALSVLFTITLVWRQDARKRRV
ncbi:inner membrane protein YbjM [Mangrovibacter yixingensis]|uniref:inner membrane protein YbjM n=1 Tax=Mangrovibacter yixingensis TaxID=1529639 RepID=UPI001CFB6DF3|nr:inner membrane protein YbjM [Mangrovibacter yixingensis]